MKLQDLFEASVGSDISFDDELDLEQTIKLIKKSCSNSIQLIQNDHLIYRGWKYEDIPPYCLIDPTKTTRKSEGTSNYYTLIFDNHPEMKEYPKRSKSLICTTDLWTAKKYSVKQRCTMVIPFDTTKIGIVNKSDIWDVNCKLFNCKLSLEHLNIVFKKSGITDNNWDTFKHQLQDDEFKNKFLDILNDYQHSIGNNSSLYDNVIEAYSPKNTGFTSCYTANYNVSGDSEAWIGGKCILIHLRDIEHLDDVLAGLSKDLK